MNRIILIGNGFDLSCGLKTSYSHFIDWFWKEKIKYYSENKKIKELNNLIKLPPEMLSIYSDVVIDSFEEADSYAAMREILLARWSQLKSFELQNKFLEIISEKNIENWVDIEEEYYLQLKKIIQFNNSTLTNIQNEKIRLENLKILNSDFEKIKMELETFLTEKQKSHLFRFDYENIQEDFNLKDFTSLGTEEIGKRYFSDTEEKKEEFQKLFLRMKNSGGCDTSIYPKNTLFLTFNYTYLIKKIAYDIRCNRDFLEDWAKSQFDVIHIHGELNKLENPIIFGYGDENDELHNEIEKRGGEYLNNVKTINYLKNNNYKNLLRFIEGDMYQVFIWGHSCGLSDKTMLKTMFEHENCVSIKPFYYKDENGKHNYDDIVKNIYRIFSDKALMREKVVNEKYCKPLVQCKS